MIKESTKEKILAHAALIMREKGFNNTGIQEILQSAGVPKGSFYFYFRSKEELGLALIDYFAQFFSQMSESTLKDVESPPLIRLEKFFDGFQFLCEQAEGRSGCPIGNLTQEMGVLSAVFQEKLRNVFNRMNDAIRECLEQARDGHEIDQRLDPNDTANFILNSWEGALLRMKAEGNTGPLMLFKKMIFDHVLQR